VGGAADAFNFPAARENTAKIAISRSIRGEIAPPIFCYLSKPWGKFPKQSNREINRPNREPNPPNREATENHQGCARSDRQVRSSRVVELDRLPLSRHFAKPLDSFGVDAKMVRSGRTMIVTEANPYEIGLDKNAANYVPLTPMGFLLRSASIYPDRLAVAYGQRRYIAGTKRCNAAAGSPEPWQGTASAAATP
jgi:hypothetical protein